MAHVIQFVWNIVLGFYAWRPPMPPGLASLTSLFERRGPIDTDRLEDSNASMGAASGSDIGHTQGEGRADASPAGLQEHRVWRPSKLGIATVDNTLDVAQLRWVGTEFIYFLDIPWDYEFQSEGTKNPDGQRGLDGDVVHPEHKPSRRLKKLSMRSITIDLLEDIMDIQIPPECLLSVDDFGQRMLSSDLLARLVVPWAQQLHNLDATHSHKSAPERGTFNRDALKAVTTSLDKELYSKSGSLLDGGPDSNMACAMATMLSSMESCIQAIWKVGGGDVVDRTQMYGEVNQILRQKLQVNWGYEASFEMERLLAAGIPFAAYAISHRRTINNVSLVDTETYRPKHTTPFCTCPFVKPSLSAVYDLVKDNQVPVIVYDGTQVVVRSARDVAYVAISHVWADGLGSTTEDGLPGCQVQRLARLAGILTPGGNAAFWQDGLCIPKEKEYRNRAIALMRETYADAGKVLVLDDGLRTSCSQSTVKEECLLRIATSGWTQRIWTLQEGMLARELHFELMDGIIDCTHFNGFSFALAQKVFPLLKYRLGATPLTYEQHLDNPPTCTVNEIIGLLRYRTTSKRQDEPVAISGLLGVNTGTLTALESGEERMKSLLIQARELPRQLAVFGWYCDRLRHIPNFGWAPDSLSKMLWPGDPDDPRKAICTEDGLFGEFTVVSFEPVEFPEYIGIILIVKDPEAESETEPRVFNLVLSPYQFRVSERRTFTVGGFLLKGQALEESMREEGVGAIVLSPESEQVPHPVDQRQTLACKFVCPASVRFGLPDRVQTARSRYAWIIAHATVEPYRVVRVT